MSRRATSPRRSSGVAWAELLLLTLLGAACATGADDGAAGRSPECVRNQDCGPDQVCRSSECVPALRTCDAGPACPDLPADDGGVEACLRPSECPNGRWCLNNVCVPAVRLEDAGSDPSEETGQGDLSDACTGSACGGDPVDEPVEPDESDATDECEGRDDGRLGESCDEAADCCNGLCLGSEAAGRGFCTEPCDAWSQCNPVGFRDDYYCLEISPGQRLCAFSDYEETCNLADECLGQVCLKGQGTSGCSVRCRSIADCPPGAGCGAVFFADGAGGFVSLDVCTPVGANCAVFDTGLNNCLSGVCVTEDVGSIGFCSVFCQTGRGDQCPVGWSCQIVEVGQPAICVAN